MSMKVMDIVIMVNSGVMEITCNNLTPPSQYKVLKFKRALNKTFENIQSIEKYIMDYVDVGDIQTLDSELKKLKEKKSRSLDEEEKLKSMSDKMEKYLSIRMEMLKDNIDLDVSPIPYEEWHTLRQENRPKDNKEILTNYIEDVLKGILWEEPD